MQQLTTPFSNAQIELLKLFSTNLTDSDLVELKRILLEFKFRRVTAMADKLWDEKGWNNDDMNRLLHTHMRKPYRSQNDYLKNKPSAS